MGIPGMDQVIGSLHKVHMTHTAPQMPQSAMGAGAQAAQKMPQRMAQPTMPQQQQQQAQPTMPQQNPGAMQGAGSVGGYYGQLQQVQNMMPGAKGRF